MKDLDIEQRIEKVQQEEEFQELNKEKKEGSVGSSEKKHGKHHQRQLSDFAVPSQMIFKQISEPLGIAPLVESYDELEVTKSNPNISIEQIFEDIGVEEKDLDKGSALDLPRTDFIADTLEFCSQEAAVTNKTTAAENKETVERLDIQVNKSSQKDCQQIKAHEQRDANRDQGTTGQVDRGGVHSLGERVSTTSSIFHNNMFFMNCEFDKQQQEEGDKKADKLVENVTDVGVSSQKIRNEQEIVISPAKSNDELLNSISGCGNRYKAEVGSKDLSLVNDAGNSLSKIQTNQDLKIKCLRSSQVSEGLQLPPEINRVQENSNNMSDAQSQSQNYLGSSVFKFNEIFDTFSEMVPPQSVSNVRNSDSQSPTKYDNQSQKKIVKHASNFSIEKENESSQNGCSMRSNENLDDFPIERLDFLNNDFEDEQEKIYGSDGKKKDERANESSEEEDSHLAPLIERQQSLSATKSYISPSYYKPKWTVSRDNDNMSTNSVDRAIFLSKVSKHSSGHYRRGGGPGSSNSQKLDVDFISAQQIGNNQFQLKGLRNKDQVRLFIDELKNKRIEPAGLRYFHDTVILDLKNIRDCQNVRKILGDLEIGLRTTSENPNQIRSRRIVYGQQLELIQEKENDHQDWSNSDVDKSLSNKRSDISGSSQSNSNLMNHIKLKDYNINHHHHYASLTQYHNYGHNNHHTQHYNHHHSQGHNRRFKHSNSNKFQFNTGRNKAIFGGSIASFHTCGNADSNHNAPHNNYHKLRPNSNLEDGHVQEANIKIQNRQALSGRSDSLKSNTLLQFKQLNEQDDKEGNQQLFDHDNLSDDGGRVAAHHYHHQYHRQPGWKGMHTHQVRDLSEEQQHHHHSQGPYPHHHHHPHSQSHSLHHHHNHHHNHHHEHSIDLSAGFDHGHGHGNGHNNSQGHVNPHHVQAHGHAQGDHYNPHHVTAHGHAQGDHYNPHHVTAHGTGHGHGHCNQTNHHTGHHGHSSLHGHHNHHHHHSQHPHSLHNQNFQVNQADLHSRFDSVNNFQLRGKVVKERALSDWQHMTANRGRERVSSDSSCSKNSSCYSGEFKFAKLNEKQYLTTKQRNQDRSDSQPRKRSDSTDRYDRQIIAHQRRGGADSPIEQESTNQLQNRGQLTPRSQQVPNIKNQLNFFNQVKVQDKTSEMVSSDVNIPLHNHNKQQTHHNHHQANSTGHFRDSFVGGKQQNQGAPSLQSSDSAVLSYIQPLNIKQTGIDLQNQKLQQQNQFNTFYLKQQLQDQQQQQLLQPVLPLQGCASQQSLERKHHPNYHQQLHLSNQASYQNNITLEQQPVFHNLAPNANNNNQNQAYTQSNVQQQHNQIQFTQNLQQQLPILQQQLQQHNSQNAAESAEKLHQQQYQQQQQLQQLQQLALLTQLNALSLAQQQFTQQHSNLYQTQSPVQPNHPNIHDNKNLSQSNQLYNFLGGQTQPNIMFQPQNLIIFQQNPAINRHFGHSQETQYHPQPGSSMFPMETPVFKQQQQQIQPNLSNQQHLISSPVPHTLTAPTGHSQDISSIQSPFLQHSSPTLNFTNLNLNQVQIQPNQGQQDGSDATRPESPKGRSTLQGAESAVETNRVGHLEQDAKRVKERGYPTSGDDPQTCQSQVMGQGWQETIGSGGQGLFKAGLKAKVQVKQQQKVGKHIKNAKVKKKVLIGPKNNQIDLTKILQAQQCIQIPNGQFLDEDDQEIQSLTTLMIKNIPVKFLQGDMLKLLNKNFYGKFDYFYLPMDLQTQCSVGFAFINMLHPLYILDFYLEFNQIHWSDHVPLCNSSKKAEIVYANVQGIDHIKQQLYDKNIMKKNDQNIKPIFQEQFKADPYELEQIKIRFTQDQQFIKYFHSKLLAFKENGNHRGMNNHKHRHNNRTNRNNHNHHNQNGKHYHKQKM